MTEPTARPLPSSVPVLRKTLVYGFAFAGLVALVGAIIGAVVVGPIGVWSAVIGAAMAAVFLGITALSILIAVRFDIVAFFGIVLGAWLLKFVLFIVAALALRNQPWISSTVLFLTLICGVAVSLVVDVVVVMKTRMPYVSDLGSNQR
jgi:magnesium-transporting ATPase (P-type)